MRPWGEAQVAFSLPYLGLKLYKVIPRPLRKWCRHFRIVPGPIRILLRMTAMNPGAIGKRRMSASAPIYMRQGICSAALTKSRVSCSVIMSSWAVPFSAESHTRRGRDCQAFAFVCQKTSVAGTGWIRWDFDITLAFGYPRTLNWITMTASRSGRSVTGRWWLLLPVESPSLSCSPRTMLPVMPGWSTPARTEGCLGAFPNSLFWSKMSWKRGFRITRKMCA